MKILHIGYALEKASGVTTFVENVAAEQRLAGHEVDVVDAAKVRGTDEERRVLENIGKHDVVHLHCLWQLHVYAKAANAAHVPIVFSTHGMTAPWAMRHKRWKKKFAWWLYQRSDLKAAAAIHCTTEQEVEWNRGYGLTKCFVAPLGTNESLVVSGQSLVTSGQSLVASGQSLVASGRSLVASGQSLVASGDARVLLFVGRIHPVKGLENLIRAWGVVDSCQSLVVSRQSLVVSRESLVDSRESLVVSGKRWKLRIVGPDEDDYLSSLMSLVSRLGLDASVEFAGPKYGDDLSREYEACDCLVLPSFTENFGATVVDAMAHGKPVITSTFTPWSEVADRKCGWWVSNEPNVLADAIRQMMQASDDERGAMGERGRQLVGEKYVWSVVAEKIISQYNGIKREVA